MAQAAGIGEWLGTTLQRLARSCRHALSLPAAPNHPDLYTRPGAPDVIRGDVAYAFQSDLRLRQMLKFLNARGPWYWIERDSADPWTGDYLSASAKEGRALLKLYDEDEGFVFNIAYSGPGATAVQEWDELCALVLDQLLPSLDAKQVERTRPYDRRMSRP